MGKALQSKALKPKVPPANDAVYTEVNCGVASRGLIFHGYKPPGKAIADARRHYRKELELIQAAIEALDHNSARVTYKRGGVFIGHEEAARTVPPNAI